ncbi:MAG: hypothetical protein NC419_13220, partial [Muribaculaceae bacterium]|nr:hypothetical protein [Muribaculaceae bacterium]
SVLELMKSERIISNEIPKNEATGIIVDTLDIVKLQRKQERKNALFLLGIITVIAIFVLFLDSMQWQMDTIIFTGVGVVFPLFCIFGFVILLCNAIWRKITGKSCGQTFIMALALLLLLILFMGVFFLIGALGIGPVPN